MPANRKQPSVWLWYIASIAFLAAGSILGSKAYPKGFDWMYEVMSALASSKHNPGGGIWFASGLALGMAALLPVWITLKREAATNGTRWELRWSATLALGIAGGILVGIERLFIYHISDILHKAHEALAVLSFLGLYLGTLGIAIERARSRRDPSNRWTASIIAGPLIAIGASQLSLYLDQRDLGWVDRSWRDMDIPLWLSFAFWQWLASAAIWLGLGLLLLSQKQANTRRGGESSA